MVVHQRDSMAPLVGSMPAWSHLHGLSKLGGPPHRIATILGLVLIGLLFAVANSYGQAVKIIVDTDMLTDPEDVNALWLLNTLADRGEAEILACVVNGHETNRASGAAVDVVNTWFGRPNIPLGAFKGGYPKKRSPFTPLLRDKFPHTAADDDQLPSALEIYRSVLAKQPDKSVVIVSIGFLVNLKDLLLSTPDKHSAMAGAELLRRKVKTLAVRPIPTLPARSRPGWAVSATESVIPLTPSWDTGTCIAAITRQ